MPRREANAICALQPREPCPLQRAERRELGGGEQLGGGRGVGDVELGLRRLQRALGAQAAGRASARPPTPGTRRRGREAAAAPAPGRRSAPSRSATVSSAPAVACARCQARRSGSATGIGRLRQRAMHLAAVARGGAAVDRRAHERMLEAHAEAEVDQPGGLGGPARVAADAEALRGAPQQLDVADRARPPPPAAAAACRAASDCARCRNVRSIRLASGRASGSPNPPASSAGVSPRGSSSSASGLPRVSATIRSRDALVQPPGRRRRQQRAGVRVGEPFDPQLRQPGERVAVGRLAHGEDDRDPLGQQPPGDEREHQRGGPVEPLGIVDHAQQRARPRPPRPAGSARRRRPGSGPGDRRRCRPNATCSASRCGAGRRVEPVEQRRAQVVQPGERELHLRLHADGPRDAAPGSAPRDVPEQRRLADPGLAAQHQRRALAEPDALQQPVQRFALAAATLQHRRNPSRRPIGTH